MRYWRICGALAFSGLIVLALPPREAFAVDSAPLDSISVLHVFELIGFASFGSLILYLFGKPSKADFLAVRFPSWKSGVGKEITAFLIYVIVGGVVGWFIAQPDSFRAAFMSGFGWPALLDLSTARPEPRPVEPTL